MCLHTNAVLHDFLMPNRPEPLRSGAMRCMAAARDLFAQFAVAGILVVHTLLDGVHQFGIGAEGISRVHAFLALHSPPPLDGIINAYYFSNIFLPFTTYTPERVGRCVSFMPPSV